MKRIAIFASGNGSNFQAIVDAVKNDILHAKVALVICDKPGAYVIERAKKIYRTFLSNRRSLPIRRPMKRSSWKNWNNMKLILSHWRVTCG